MSSTELLVFVGALSLLVQGMLAFVILMVFNMKNKLSNLYSVDLPRVAERLENIYLSYPTPGFFYFPNKVNKSKILPLCCLTILLYLVLGFSLASSQVTISLWMLVILIFNWNLATLIRRRLLIQEVSPGVKNSLVAICLISTAVLISQMIQISQPTAPIQSTWIIGVTCSIHSIIALFSLIKVFGKSKAVAIYTMLAWLGLFTGAVLV